MQHRLLKNLNVSPIGMGCMGLSHGYGQVPERSVSIDAIRAAVDFGCNFFDTAEVYGREMFYEGHNEEIVGDALKPCRKDVVLATKIHLRTEEVESGKDLYYLHRLNELVPVEEVAGVMGRLIDEGLIRGWGLSQVSVETLDAANRVTPVTAVQSIYSMVERGLEKDIFPYCLEHGIGVVPFSPIASGLLSGKVTVETKFEGDDVRKFVPQLSKENLVANRPLIDLLSTFAERKNATNAQISLAWMLKKYPNVVPIPGSKVKERILENLGAWNVELTDAEFAELERELDRRTVHGQRGFVESEQNLFSNHWLKAREAKS